MQLPTANGYNMTSEEGFLFEGDGCSILRNLGINYEFIMLLKHEPAYAVEHRNQSKASATSALHDQEIDSNRYPLNLFRCCSSRS